MWRATAPLLVKASGGFLCAAKCLSLGCDHSNIASDARSARPNNTGMSYESSSAQDRLDAVRSAIQACLDAQRYTIRGREKVMANLKELRALEKELQAEVNAGNSGSMVSVGKVVRPK